MKKSKINSEEEYDLSTADFANHLEEYQKAHTSETPVIFLIAQAKETNESESVCNDRKINMPAYGNTQMDAFYFYKPISTVIVEDD